MRAQGYIRVSTEGQATEGVSLENQAQQIRKYCEFRQMDCMDVISDAGISGGVNRDRPGFMKLLGLIESRSIDAVVIYSVERLSRDMITLLVLERLLSEYDIQLHTIDGRIDTGSPDGYMAYAMKAFLAEIERRQVKYRTTMAMAHKRRKGEVVGAVPYGFRRVGASLERNESEQRVIDEANRLYKNGCGLSNIALTLTSRGWLTRTGRTFDTTQVRRIVANYSSSHVRRTSSMGKVLKTFIESVS